MAMLREWLCRLVATFGWGRRDRDVEAELRSHLELAAEDRLGNEGNERDTERVTRVMSGGVMQAMEAIRDQRRLPTVESTVQDLRCAIRLLARRPGHTLLAVATLAIGLALNTVAFSLVNSLLYRSARMAGGDEIGWVFLGTQSGAPGYWPLPLYERVQREARTVGALAAEGRFPLGYQASGTTEQIWGLAVSSNYFSTVTVPLAHGRAWHPDEPAADRVVVLISERFWRTRFNGTPDLASLTFRINRQIAHVVGVVDDHFEDPGGVFEPDVFVPLVARSVLNLPARFADVSLNWLTVIARPTREGSAAAIEADIALIVLDELKSRSDAAATARVSYTRLADGSPLARELRVPAAAGLTAVFAVLLIACFNVAGLLLARSVERQREFALRSALGASRARLVRQLLMENLLVALLAAAGAVFVTSQSPRLLAAFSLPAPIPLGLQFPIDWRLFVYTGLLALVAATIPALVPAWQVLRSDPAASVKAGGGSVGGRRQTMVRRTFVIVQTAGSTVFLAAALLFGQSLLKALSHAPGFDTDHTLVAELDPVLYGHTPEQAERLLAQITQELRRLPGVRDVAIADGLPFAVGPPRTSQLSLDGRDCRVGPCPTAESYAVDEHFFLALGIGVLSGRTFAAGEPPEAVVISEAAAAQFWPGTSPLGRTFREGPEARVRRVVGVVPDVDQRAVGEAVRPHVYQPLTRGSFERSLHVVVHAETSPMGLIQPIREVVQALDAGLPLRSVQTMRERLALPLWLPRTLAAFFAVCGGLAVLLASVGLFGVTYYLVLQRTREFGVRLAIGSTNRSLRRLVGGEALRLVSPGILIGIVAAVGLAMAVRSVLFGVTVADPLPYLLAAVIQALVASAASWAPALRAGRVDPVGALRAD